MSVRFITSPHAQGTPEWRQDRLGRVTGSNCAAVFMSGRTKGSESETRAKLKRELLAERLTGQADAGGFKGNYYTDWGKAQEPHSRMAYEAEQGLDVAEAGFLYLPDLMTGCSVDGLVLDGGRLGVWESKSPSSETHLDYMANGVIPKAYMTQVVHNVWVTGAQFVDFQSFDPRMPAGLQAFVVRVERADLPIAQHEAGILQFLAELDQEEASWRKRVRSSILFNPFSTKANNGISQ